MCLWTKGKALVDKERPEIKVSGLHEDELKEKRWWSDF